MSGTEKSGTGDGEIARNDFAGPTGVQSGASNTQVNYYSMTPPPPSSARGAGAGRRGRTVALVAVVVLVVAVSALVATRFGMDSGADGKGGQAPGPAEPEAPRSEEPSPAPSGGSPPSPGGEPEPAPSTGEASEPPGQTRPGNITAPGGALCAEVKHDRGEDLTPLQLWDCNRLLGQVWEKIPVGTEGGFNLRTYNKCMDVAGENKAVGTEVILFRCTLRSGQEWRSTGEGRLYNPLSGLCLGYPEGDVREAAHLHMYPCDSDAAGVWTFH